MAVSLDEVDVQLLTALQEDADRTNVELARLAGLSRAATCTGCGGWSRRHPGDPRRGRPGRGGLPLQVYVTAHAGSARPRSSRVFDDLIRSLPQIIAAVNVAGETDYVLDRGRPRRDRTAERARSLATRGGTRLVTYLRLEEIKPPSRLAAGPGDRPGPPPRRPPEPEPGRLNSERAGIHAPATSSRLVG